MRTLKAVFILLLMILLQSCNQKPHWHASDVTGMMPDLEFSLTGPEGEVVSAHSLRGQPVLLFFGFTNCPHICPTTLTQLSVVMKKLGPSADNVKVALITVDPDRDTPAVLKSYTASFGPWFLGLTGSNEALARLRKTYGVYAAMESSEEKGSYNVMHTTAVFAFDAQGQVRLLMSDLTDAEAVMSDLNQLIDQ